MRTDLRAKPATALWLLGALTALAPLSVDAYLPALPQLATGLRASASATQITHGACLIGLAAGQAVAGPLSDVRGRRRPLLAGLAAFVLASLLCAAAPSLPTLIACRFAQGAAAANVIVLAQAIVADSCAGTARAQAYARLLTIAAAMPALAPIAGAQLLQISSWRGIFIATAGLGACLLAASARALPETLVPASRRTDSGLHATLASVCSLAQDGRFAGYAVAQGCAFAAMFAYIAAAPVILQDRYHLSADQFSAIFAINELGIMAAAHTGRVLLRRTSSRQLLRLGLGILGTGAGGLLAAVILESSRWIVLPSLFFIAASIGLILPHAAALALAGRAPNDTGSASALLGVSQFTIGTAAAPIAGLMGSKASSPSPPWSPR